MDLFDIDLELVGDHLLRMAIAFALALPVAWDRERTAKRASLGLRTFPLVAMASCGYMLVGQTVAPDGPGQARILQGLVTGIGFLGGGAIIKKGVNVFGTATAASIWTTAALGAAIAYNRLEIAIALAVVTFVTLNLLRPVKEAVSGEKEEPEDTADDGSEEKS